ncbi:aquaporin Z [Glaciihabitans arcticus]|uniref:Aquaporin Z n=1 Tax=Glaciihabitans arcticus TaxID=2668039 RepID=A0A4Q9GTV8_9MICO|nr:aquaporin Z [Glaciihabitans arcticus]TBN55993.1 aquaporin Z [Glaciihabitans arcticus]
MTTPVVNADVELDETPGLHHRIAAEAFGTFVLVFGVIGTALFASGNTGLLGVALAVGLTVIGAAYAVGHISGGHFNPAVTLGAAAAGRFAWKDVVPYILAQVLGGILATTLLSVVRSNGPANLGTFGDVSNGFGLHSPGNFTLVGVIVAEVILTAIFLFVILGVTDRRAPSGFAPLAIGLTLTLIHLVAIPISNASINPARSIATAIYGGGDAMGQLWVFLVAPVVGALIAGFSYSPLFESRKA